MEFLQCVITLLATKFLSYAIDKTGLLLPNHVIYNIIHLMSVPEGNSLFCFPESLDVSQDEVKGNIEIRGKTKLTISQGNRH